MVDEDRTNTCPMHPRRALANVAFMGKTFDICNSFSYKISLATGKTCVWWEARHCDQESAIIYAKTSGRVLCMAAHRYFKRLQVSEQAVRRFENAINFFVFNYLLTFIINFGSLLFTFFTILELEIKVGDHCTVTIKNVDGTFIYGKLAEVLRLFLEA